MSDLTDKQRRFIEEYCVDFNATQAAIRAGYKERAAYATGWENLRKPDIAEAIGERLEELALGPKEALKALGDMARASIEDCVELQEDGGWKINLNKAKEKGVLRFINELSFDRSGKPKIKMYDVKDAIDKILRAHGAYQDRLDVTSGDKAIPPIQVQIINTQDAGG